MVQWGCATHRTSHRVESEQLGKLGVVSAQYTPTFDFELPAKGWLGGAGRGAVEGTFSFIRLVPQVVVGGATIFLGPIGIAGVLYAVNAAVAGAGYMIVGPFYGAAVAQSPETVEESEAQLKAALGAMHIQETMRDHVVQSAQSLSNVDLMVLEGQGPVNSSDLLNYFPLQQSHIDCVLELRVYRVWLSAKRSRIRPELHINPFLSLGMEVRGRLIQVKDKVVLYENIWTYSGESRLFAEWAANDAQLLSDEFDRAYDGLAGQISTSIFQ